MLKTVQQQELKNQMNFQVKLFMAWLFILSNYAASDEINEITYREPPQNPAGAYVKDLLKLIYYELGREIKFIKVPASRELLMVEQGKLTGALARDKAIEEKYKTLIPIPIPIFKFQLVKVSNSKFCGECKLANIDSICFKRGSLISNIYIKKLPKAVNKCTVKDSRTLNSLLIKNRLDSILLMDFEITPKIRVNDNYIKHTIDNRYNYHYLSPNNKLLVKPIMRVMEKLKNEGAIGILKAKHKFQVNR